MRSTYEIRIYSINFLRRNKYIYIYYTALNNRKKKSRPTSRVT